MDHASIINFLSNEDIQELAPGFFIGRRGSIARSLLLGSADTLGAEFLKK
jgi:hypothetical protein